MAKLAKRRSPQKPIPPARQLTLDGLDTPDAQAAGAEAAGAEAAATKPKPAGKPVSPDAAAVAKRAVARRGPDPAGRVRIVVALKVAAAEALSERAIRETRNLEDIAAEILEREAGR